MIKAAKKIDAFKKGPHFSPQTDKHKKNLPEKLDRLKRSFISIIILPQNA